MKREIRIFVLASVADEVGSSGSRRVLDEQMDDEGYRVFTATSSNAHAYHYVACYTAC
jgi:pyridoxine/pyridoxamine 5'-phosphate oxidase